MEKISLIVNKKIDHFAWVLLINGLCLMFLAVFIVWIPYMLEIVIGFAVLLVACVFLYAAYKVWHLKKILEKYLKF
jgi:hypothetical protein